MSGDETFLGRWSRRKQAPPEAAKAEDHEVAEVRADDERQAAVRPQATQHADAAPVPGDLPSVESLTCDADFTRFMRPDVPPRMKNAALRKLFTDPHFNVMDGLDIYIDDYTKADPIPESMLRDLAQSRMLGLFDHEDAKEVRDAGDESAEAPVPAAASATAVTPVLAPPVDAPPPLAQPGQRAEPAVPAAVESGPPSLRLRPL